MFEYLKVIWTRPGQAPKFSDRVWPCAADLRLGLVIPLQTEENARWICAELNDGKSWAKYHFAAIDLCYYADTLQPLVSKTGPVDVSNNTIINILGLDYVVPSQVSGHIIELRKALAAAALKLAELEKTPAQRGDESAARWREGVAAFARANGID